MTPTKTLPFPSYILNVWSLIGVCESKLDTSVLEQEIRINNYKILCCERKDMVEE